MGLVGGRQASGRPGAHIQAHAVAHAAAPPAHHCSRSTPHSNYSKRVRRARRTPVRLLLVRLLNDIQALWRHQLAHRILGPARRGLAALLGLQRDNTLARVSGVGGQQAAARAARGACHRRARGVHDSPAQTAACKQSKLSKGKGLEEHTAGSGVQRRGAPACSARRACSRHPARPAGAGTARPPALTSRRRRRRGLC